MAKLVRTNDVATEDELRKLFSMDAEDELQDVVLTHDGAWWRDNDHWWFWVDPTTQDEED